MRRGRRMRLTLGWKVSRKQYLLRWQFAYLEWSSCSNFATFTSRWRPCRGHRCKIWYNIHALLHTSNPHQRHRHERWPLPRREHLHALAWSSPITRRHVGRAKRTLQHYYCGRQANELLLGQSSLPISYFQVSLCTARVASEKKRWEKDQVSRDG